MRRNFFTKLYVKIISQEGTPESVGRGMAIGLFIGFILPVGLQTIPALALAFLFKANKALTWLFTCISNPASIFVLYPIQCYTGSLLVLKPISFASLDEKFGAIASADGFRAITKAFLDLGADIMIAFFAGGLFYGTIFALAGYWTGSRLVRLYRTKKAKRRAERQQKQKLKQD